MTISFLRVVIGHRIGRVLRGLKNTVKQDCTLAQIAAWTAADEPTDPGPCIPVNVSKILSYRQQCTLARSQEGG